MRMVTNEGDNTVTGHWSEWSLVRQVTNPDPNPNRNRAKLLRNTDSSDQWRFVQVTCPWKWLVTLKNFVQVSCEREHHQSKYLSLIWVECSESYFVLPFRTSSCIDAADTNFFFFLSALHTGNIVGLVDLHISDNQLYIQWCSCSRCTNNKSDS